MDKPLQIQWMRFAIPSAEQVSADATKKNICIAVTMIEFLSVVMECGVRSMTGIAEMNPMYLQP